MILNKRVAKFRSNPSSPVEYELVSIDTNDILRHRGNMDKIHLIKEYRRLSGKGLMDSKNAVEAHWDNPQMLIEVFKKVCDWKPEMIKEEFMNIVSDAIDGADKMYFEKDYVKIMKVLIENIESQGGIKAIAEKREEFIQSL